jgi:hypothetical protein
MTRLLGDLTFPQKKLLSAQVWQENVMKRSKTLIKRSKTSKNSQKRPGIVWKGERSGTVNGQESLGTLWNE